MRTLLLAELRGSLRTWLGVSLAFVATNFALVLPALVEASMVVERDKTASLSVLAGVNMVYTSLVALVVLGTATNLALSARRGALARLALNGATPRQIVRTVIVQLVAMSLLSSVIGAVLALLALRPVLAFLVTWRQTEASEEVPFPEPVYSLPIALAAVAIAVVVAVVGGLRQTRRASKVPPVDAVRQHASGDEGAKMSPFRIVMAVIIGIAVVGSYLSVFSTAAEVTPDTVFNLMQASLLVLVLLAMLFSLLAPVLIRPLTFAWVRLLPLAIPSWQLARRTVYARAPRLVRSVVPVMMTIGLLLGMASVVGSLQGTFDASGYHVEVHGTGWRTMLILLGLPLLLSLSGGVGSLIMMSKQRDAELALLGVVGATPRQRLLVPLLEAVIISVTATILALVMTAGAVGLLALGFPMTHKFVFAFVPPYGIFVGAVLVTFAITIAATVVPTLRARSMSEPAVIARLVAD